MIKDILKPLDEIGDGKSRPGVEETEAETSLKASQPAKQSAMVRTHPVLSERVQTKQRPS